MLLHGFIEDLKFNGSFLFQNVLFLSSLSTFDTLFKGFKRVNENSTQSRSQKKDLEDADTGT